MALDWIGFDYPDTQGTNEKIELENKPESDNESIDISTKLKTTIEERFKPLGISWYDQFLNYVLSLSSDIQSKLLESFIDFEDLAIEFFSSNDDNTTDEKEWGYILNEDYLLSYSNFLWLDLQIDEKEEYIYHSDLKKELRSFSHRDEYYESLNNFDNILIILKDLWKNDRLRSINNDKIKELFTLIDSLKWLSWEELIKKLEDIDRYISDNLEALLDAVRKNTPWWYESDLYKSFSSAVSAMNPTLLERVNSYRNLNPDPESPSIFTHTLKWWLWSEPEKDWYNLRDRQTYRETNTNILVDTSKYPPQRFLEDNTTWYKLKTDLAVWDFYPATVEYEEVRQDLEPKISSLKDAIVYIENLNLDNISLEDIKSTLLSILWQDLYTYFGIANISSKEDIKTSIVPLIRNRLWEFEDKLKKAKEKYKRDLESLEWEYRKKLFERDEKTKDMLKFLHSIWFDLIPQSITDQLIDYLNSQNSLRGALWFTWEIDLWKGLLWSSQDLGDSDVWVQEKFLFARFVNIFISSWEEGPINTSAIIEWNWVPVWDFTPFREAISDINWLWWFSTAKKNIDFYLEKREKEYKSFNMDDIKYALNYGVIKDRRIIDWAKERLLNEQVSKAQFDYQDLWYEDMLREFLARFSKEEE